MRKFAQPDHPGLLPRPPLPFCLIKSSKSAQEGLSQTRTFGEMSLTLLPNKNNVHM
jgi:hypothetical protein